MDTRTRDRDERYAELTAVVHALTEAERILLLGNARRRYQGMDGAAVDDVLDYTDNYDEFLNQTEPFFERFADQLPDGVTLRFAAHALILLGRKLTPGRVIALLQRAGVTEVPRYPDVEVGLLAHDDPDDVRGDANHLLLMARAEQGLRAQGVPESEITEFRNSVRETGVPGFSRNAADIACWVTFTDRYTPMPRKVYDPVDDLAVVTVAVLDASYRARTSPELAQALANLRSHLDLSTVEALQVSLRAFFGREDRA
jgi:hypothetical protein